AALVARAFEAAGEDLGQRADERSGVTGVARGLVDHLLELVTGPGDGFAGEFVLAAGEVGVGRSAGRAAVADHVGEGGGVVAALAEQLGGGADHPGAAVGASGHGPDPTLDLCMTSNLVWAKSCIIPSNWGGHEREVDEPWRAPAARPAG